MMEYQIVQQFMEYQIEKLKKNNSAFMENLRKISEGVKETAQDLDLLQLIYQQLTPQNLTARSPQANVGPCQRTPPSPHKLMSDYCATPTPSPRDKSPYPAVEEQTVYASNENVRGIGQPLEEFMPTLGQDADTDFAGLDQLAIVNEELPAINKECGGGLDQWALVKEELVAIKKESFPTGEVIVIDRDMAEDRQKKYGDLFDVENRICLCGESAQLFCSKCMSVMYCSKRCQLEHWSVHQTTCIVTKQEIP